MAWMIPCAPDWRGVSAAAPGFALDSAAITSPRSSEPVGMRDKTKPAATAMTNPQSSRADVMSSGFRPWNAAHVLMAVMGFTMGAASM